MQTNPAKEECCCLQMEKSLTCGFISKNAANTSGFPEQGRNSTSKSLLGITLVTRTNPTACSWLAGACWNSSLEENSCQGAGITQLCQQPRDSQCQGTACVKPSLKPWHKHLTLCRKRRKLLLEQVRLSISEWKREIGLKSHSDLPFPTFLSVNKIATYWTIYRN